ncbi:MAG: cation:proton antiporter, partial [Paramuribaculum sp.]|nr:cation:proton antiporter [Paramuribaculum sp.]
MILASASAAGFDIEGLISDLAFILILGGLTTLLFKWLKQPVVLGYIVAGFLASPNFTYLPSVTTEANIDFWAELGIVILLFSLGLEFSFRKLLNAGGSAIVTATLNIIGMIAIGFLIGHAMNFTTVNSIFLGCMISMASTTIIIKALNDLGLQHRRFAPLVFAVLVVEDLFAVVMMVILSSIAINQTVEGGEML